MERLRQQLREAEDSPNLLWHPGLERFDPLSASDPIQVALDGLVRVQARQ